MRGPRAFLVALLAAAMVLSSVAGASAASLTSAPFSDVPSGSAAATAIGMLAQEGVVNGIGGGEFGPDMPVTRAEMAKIIVGFLGETAAASALATTTPSFKDGLSIPTWAWGYVNDAQAIGVIKGYPDHTFRPDGDVTVAEALAMFTRALGDDWSVTGVWPNDYTVAGFQLGIATGLTGLAASAPALRGQVAQMAYNAALQAKYSVVSSGTNTLLPGGLYAKNATSDSYPQAVSGTVSQAGSTSLAITPAAPAGANAGTYALAASVTLVGGDALGATLDGATVTAIVDANKKIDWIDVTQAGSGASASSGSGSGTGSGATASATDTLNDGTQTAPPSGFVRPSSGSQATADSSTLLVVQDAAGNDYLLFKDGSTLQYFPSTTVSVDGVNYGDLYGNEPTVLQPGESVTYTTANGLADNVALVRWAVVNGRITAVNPSTGLITYTLDQGSAAPTYQVAAANAQVTLNGGPSALSSLHPDDIVDIELPGTASPTPTGVTPVTAVAVQATRRTVSGKVTGVNTSTGASGSNTTFTLQTSGGSVTLTTDAQFPPNQVPAPNSEVTLALDGAGNARYVVNTATASAPVVMLTRTGTSSTSTGTEVTLTGVGASGTVTYAEEPGGFTCSGSSACTSGQLAAASNGFNNFWALGLAADGNVQSATFMPDVTSVAALPTGDSLRVQSVTSQTVVIKLVRSDGTLDSAGTQPSGPGWAFSGGYLVIVHGGAWSGMTSDRYIGFQGLQPGDPVTLYAATVTVSGTATPYFAIVDAYR